VSVEGRNDVTDEFIGEAGPNQFDLGPYREHWLEYLRLREENKRYVKYHARFRELADKHDELVLDGQVVFTNTISGAFSTKWLSTEHPHLHSAYLKDQVVKVFDEEAFKRDHETLWTSGRARSLREKK
jgi:hypothetical protein